MQSSGNPRVDRLLLLEQARPVTEAALRRALRVTLGRAAEGANVPMIEKRDKIKTISGEMRHMWQFWFRGTPDSRNYPQKTNVIKAEMDEVDGLYTWRLYVNRGDVATLSHGKARTESGMRRQVQNAANRKAGWPDPRHTETGMREQKGTIGAAYVQWVRDSEKWAADIKKGLKKEFRYLAPDRPALALRTGFGHAHLRRIFANDAVKEYWDNPTLYQKTKNHWKKWDGEPSKQLFADSAKGREELAGQWGRKVGYW